MATRAGGGYIDILPRFGPQWNAQLEAGMRASAQRAGQSLEDGVGRSVTNVQSRLSALGGVMGQLGGQASPLGGIFGQLFSQVETGFGRMSTAAESARMRVGGALEGIGVVALGLGAIFEHLAAPLEKSMADAIVAIRNTDSPVEEFQGRFEAAASKMENFGFKTADTLEALAKLTVATKDPNEALNELQFTATLAAAKHESLSEAATQVGRAHAGNFRAFKEYNLDLQVVANADAKAEAAAEAHATALDGLHTAQERLVDFESRMAEKRQAAQEAYAEKVQAADERILDTETALSDFRARAADEFAQKTEQASDRVVASEASVADAIRATQEARESANQSLDDALERLADINAQQAVEGDPKLQAELRRQAQKRDAEQAVTRARQNVTDVATSGAERVSKAQDAEAKAKSDQATLIAQGPGGSVAQQQELARLTQANQRANDDLAKLQAKGAGGVTLSDLQEEKRLREAVAAASEKERDTAVKEAQAKKDAADAQVAFANVEAEFMKREGGLLEERRKTWAGTLDALRTKIEDFFAKLGEKLAPIFQTLGGPLLIAGVLARGRGAKGAAGAAKGAGDAADDIFGGGGGPPGIPPGGPPGESQLSRLARVARGGGAAEAEAAAGGAAEAGAAAGAAEGPLAGLAAAAGPVAAVVAVVVALGVAVYEAYQHIKPFHDAVDAVGRAIKTGFGEAVGFLKEAWTNVLSPVFHGIGHVLSEVAGPAFIIFKDIAKIAFAVIVDSIKIPWESVIKPAFTLMSAIVRDVVGPAFSWLGDHVIKPVFGAFESVIGGAWEKVKGVFEAIDRHIRGPLKTAFEFIKTTWDTVWDGVKSIVSTALGVIGTVVGKIIGVVATIAEHIPGADDIGKALRNAQHDVEKLEAGGSVGPGFRTNGPRAIVGEGDPRFPEYVIATDPKYRNRNVGLVNEMLGTMGMKSGGVLGWVEDKIGTVGSGIASAAGGAVDAVNSALSSVGDIVKSIAEKGARWVLEHGWPKLPVGSDMLSVFPAGLNSMRQKVIDFLGGKDEENIIGGVGGVIPPGSLSDWIDQAISLTGVPTSWKNGLYEIAKHESGGDPHAINQWDINAKSGNPSEGLMQTTISTFRGNMLPGHGDIWNPVDNLAAAIRYILGRYHDINRVPGVASLNAGGPYKPYASGGRLDDILSVHARAADDGVTLRPGLNLVPNATGALEALERVDRARAGFDSPEIRDLIRELIDAVREGKDIHIDGELVAQVADRGMQSAAYWRS